MWAFKRKKKNVWVREAAQEVWCLVCNYEDLSLILKTHVKNPDVVVHTCNLSTGEAETN